MTLVKFVFLEAYPEDTERIDLPIFTMYRVPVTDEEFVIYVIENSRFSFRLITEPSNFKYVRFFIKLLNEYSETLRDRQHILEYALRHRSGSRFKFDVYFHLPPFDLRAVCENNGKDLAITCNNTRFISLCSHEHGQSMMHYSNNGDFHFLVWDEGLINVNDIPVEQD